MVSQICPHNLRRRTGRAAHGRILTFLKNFILKKYDSCIEYFTIIFLTPSNMAQTLYRSLWLEYHGSSKILNGSREKRIAESRKSYERMKALKGGLKTNKASNQSKFSRYYREILQKIVRGAFTNEAPYGLVKFAFKSKNSKSQDPNSGKSECQLRLQRNDGVVRSH